MQRLGSDVLYAAKVGTGFPGAEPKIRGYGALTITPRAIYYVPRQVFDLRRDTSKLLRQAYTLEQLDLPEYEGVRFFDAVPRAFERLGPSSIDGFLEKMAADVPTSLHVRHDDVRATSVGVMLFRFATDGASYALTLGLLSKKRGAVRELMTRQGLWKG
jgi:hypothetical protein